MTLDLTPIPITSIPGFRFGHYTDAQGATGCTAIVAPKGAVGGVDVRGGAPASRETDLLKPENTVDVVHAVLLSGGSAYGLEAASGAARALETRGIGLDVGVGIVPIVCSSCLFDLGVGRADIRPTISNGEAVIYEALDRDVDTPLEEGSVGAGTGASVGKLAGNQQAMKGGLGARAFAFGSLMIGAVAAVNAVGNIVDPRTLAPIAGMRPTPDSLEICDMEELMLAMGRKLVMPLDGTNTTLSCIVTNASLNKAQATKIAQMAADAYAHTIRPTHTTNDGDAVYVLATGASDHSGDPELPLDLIGLLATRALEAAIVAGCTEASEIDGLPAYRDLLR